MSLKRRYKGASGQQKFIKRVNEINNTDIEYKMETSNPGKIKLMEGGRDEFERTNEFMNKVAEIRKGVTDKYSPILSNERNWLGRLFIKVKIEIEIRKKIQALSSLKNLHAINY